MCMAWPRVLQSQSQAVKPQLPLFPVAFFVPCHFLSLSVFFSLPLLSLWLLTCFSALSSYSSFLLNYMYNITHCDLLLNYLWPPGCWLFYPQLTQQYTFWPLLPWKCLLWKLSNHLSRRSPHSQTLYQMLCWRQLKTIKYGPLWIPEKVILHIRLSTSALMHCCDTGGCLQHVCQGKLGMSLVLDIGELAHVSIFFSLLVYFTLLSQCYWLCNR